MKLYAVYNKDTKKVVGIFNEDQETVGWNSEKENVLRMSPEATLRGAEFIDKLLPIDGLGVICSDELPDIK